MLDSNSFLFLSYISLLCSFSVGIHLTQLVTLHCNTNEYTIKINPFITACALVYITLYYPLIGYASIAYSFYPFTPDK